MISDEAYEDVVFDGEHVSIASLPGMYERTIPLYTFSKSYAMTGLRLGYVAIKNAAIRDRAKKVLFYTASNVASVVQYRRHRRARGIAGLHRGLPHGAAGAARSVLPRHRRAAAAILPGEPPAGAFYAFLGSIRAGATASISAAESLSWRMAEYLIKNGRIGCVPGVDFGAERRRLRALLLRARPEGARPARSSRCRQLFASHRLEGLDRQDETCRPS